jgi:hypothetical protein
MKDDNGKYLSELFAGTFSFNLVLTVHPTVAHYKSTANTIRLAKICRFPKAVDNDERYSKLLESQLKESETLARN